MITWHQRLLNLQSRYGRKPTLAEMLEESKHHTMTLDEVQAQRESWARANISTGDPRWD